MKMLVFSPWQPLWLPSLKPRQRLQPSRITDMVDTGATVGMEATVDTALEDTGDTAASERPRLSPTMAMEDTVEDTEATGATVATWGATMASVRLRLSPTMATEDTVEDTVEDTEATGATVATVVATTASVRPMPNLRPLLSLITDTADTEATVEDMEAMVVMVLDIPGVTTASVRLRLSPTMATEDTVEDMVDTVMLRRLRRLPLWQVVCSPTVP